MNLIMPEATLATFSGVNIDIKFHYLELVPIKIEVQAPNGCKVFHSQKRTVQRGLVRSHN